jgi:hypothetical protein
MWLFCRVFSKSVCWYQRTINDLAADDRMVANTRHVAFDASLQGISLGIGIKLLFAIVSAVFGKLLLCR